MRIVKYIPTPTKSPNMAGPHTMEESVLKNVLIPCIFLLPPNSKDYDKVRGFIPNIESGYTACMQIIGLQMGRSFI